MLVVGLSAALMAGGAGLVGDASELGGVGDGEGAVDDAGALDALQVGGLGGSESEALPGLVWVLEPALAASAESESRRVERERPPAPPPAALDPDGWRAGRGMPCEVAALRSRVGRGGRGAAMAERSGAERGATGFQVSREGGGEHGSAWAARPGGCCASAGSARGSRGGERATRRTRNGKGVAPPRSAMSERATDRERHVQGRAAEQTVTPTTASYSDHTARHPARGRGRFPPRRCPFRTLGVEGS